MTPDGSLHVTTHIICAFKKSNVYRKVFKNRQFFNSIKNNMPTFQADSLKKQKKHN